MLGPFIFVPEQGSPQGSTTVHNQCQGAPATDVIVSFVSFFSYQGDSKGQSGTVEVDSLFGSKCVHKISEPAVYIIMF